MVYYTLHVLGSSLGFLSFPSIRSVCFVGAARRAARSVIQEVAHNMASSSPSCASTLGLGHVLNTTGTYPVCQRSGAFVGSGHPPRRPTAVLMAAQPWNVEVIPGWAARVRAANATCVVGGVLFAGVCDHAKRAGCECLAVQVSNRGHTRGAHHMKERLKQARKLLTEHKSSVLMHDADVFLRPVGLPRLLRELSGGLRGSSATSATARTGYDLIVSSDGQRVAKRGDKAAAAAAAAAPGFGGLVWFSGSRRSVKMLDCLLAGATDVPSSLSSHRHSAYPRVGESLDALIGSAPPSSSSSSAMSIGTSSAASALRVCSIPPSLQQRAVWWMSTPPSATRARLLCARAAGVVGKRVSLGAKGGGGAGKALLYLTPPNASIASQRLALGAAAELANRTGRALSLPRAAYVRRKQVPFCELFDANGLPEQAYAASVSRSSAEQVCGKRTFAADRVTGAGAALVCVAFADLLAQAPPSRLVHPCTERKAHHACSAPRVRAKRDAASAAAKEGDLSKGGGGAKKRQQWPSMNALPSSVMHMLSSVAKEGTPPIRNLRSPSKSTVGSGKDKTTVKAIGKKSSPGRGKGRGARHKAALKGGIDK